MKKKIMFVIMVAVMAFQIHASEHKTVHFRAIKFEKSFTESDFRAYEAAREAAMLNSLRDCMTPNSDVGQMSPNSDACCMSPTKKLAVGFRSGVITKQEIERNLAASPSEYAQIEFIHDFNQEMIKSSPIYRMIEAQYNAPEITAQAKSTLQRKMNRLLNR